jgi:hypothetical protein
MTYTFRLQVTKPARDTTTKGQRDAIVNKAITDAESMISSGGDYASYHAEPHLRVVVDFPNRLIQVM